MPFEIGHHVIRQVFDGPRVGVVQGVIRSRSTTAYYVSTGIGMVHCDPERRLRAAEQSASSRGLTSPASSTGSCAGLARRSA